VAAEETRRRLVQRASSKPEPMAGPDMQDMVGMGSSARRVNVRRREVRKAVTLGCMS